MTVWHTVFERGHNISNPLFFIVRKNLNKVFCTNNIFEKNVNYKCIQNCLSCSQHCKASRRHHGDYEVWISFKRACKGAVSNKFIEDWNAELNDTQKNPLLKTYKQVKTEFTMEPYLDLVQNYRYRKPSTVSEPVPILWQWNMEDSITFHLINMRLCPAVW